MEDYIQKQRKEFGKLLAQFEYPEPGAYEIEVDEVLGVGSYLVQPEVAIIRDVDGKIWAIPEDRHCDDLYRLVSRHDVVGGMKLQVVVVKEDGEGKITEVIVLEK